MHRPSHLALALFSLGACAPALSPTADAGVEASLPEASLPEASAPDASADAPRDAAPEAALAPCRLPALDSAWRTVATMPAVGDVASPSQQVVDFALWQDAAGHFEVLSCIRGTSEPGNTRVLHRWEGATFEQTPWTAMGIALRADAQYGETPGGLQAPFVLPFEGGYRMFYGDWEHIDSASSTDGVRFTRVLDAAGRPQLFDEGLGNNTRDPMVLRVGDHYNAYYTAYPNGRGADFVRTSTDLVHWSASRVVSSGGAAGSNQWSTECPFVHYEPAAQRYYLFRTYAYGPVQQTAVYCSPDPTDFGVDDDRYLQGVLEVAAPEVFTYQGETWLAALTPALDGIRVTRLRFASSP